MPSGGVHLLLDSEDQLHQAVHQVASDPRQAAATLIEGLPFDSSRIRDAVIGPAAIAFLVQPDCADPTQPGNPPDTRPAIGRCGRAGSMTVCGLSAGCTVWRVGVRPKPAEESGGADSSSKGAASTLEKVAEDDPVIAELQAITSMPVEEIIAALSRFPQDAMNDAGENRMQLAMGVLMPYIADEAPEDQHHYRARRMVEQAEQLLNTLEMQREQMMAMMTPADPAEEQQQLAQAFQLDGPAVQWLGPSQKPLQCSQLVAMLSAVVGLKSDGTIAIWPWTAQPEDAAVDNTASPGFLRSVFEPEGLIWYSRELQGDSVVQLAGSLLRCTALTLEGRVASWHDQSLRHPLGAEAFSALEHKWMELKVPPEAGKVIHVAASSKLFSVAATDSGMIFFWGRRPCPWRQAVVSARDAGSASEARSWLADESNTAVDAMDEYFVWYTATVVKRSADGASVLINFDGWDNKWDEWMPVCGSRLAPLHTHTSHKTQGSRGGVRKPPNQGTQVEAKLTRDGVFQPATVVSDSEDHNNLKVRLDGDGGVHVLRLSAYQIRLPRATDGTPLSPPTVDGLREGDEVFIRREEIYEAGALAMYEPSSGVLGHPIFLKLRTAVTNFDSTALFDVVSPTETTLPPCKLQPSSVIFLTPTAGRKRGTILKLEPSGMSALVRLHSDSKDPGAAAEGMVDQMLKQCHIIAVHKLTPASAIQETSEMLQAEPHCIFGGKLESGSSQGEVHPYLCQEIEAGAGRFDVLGLVTTSWSVHAALKRRKQPGAAEGIVVQWHASMEELQWQATVQHLSRSKGCKLKCSELGAVVDCAETQDGELQLCSAAIGPTTSLAAMSLGLLHGTPAEANEKQPSEGSRREDPALVEIRTLLEAEEYAEVEDLLDGFELNRREHITYMLRLEQDRPTLSISSLSKSAAAAPASKPQENLPVAATVVVFSATKSALLDIVNSKLPEDKAVLLNADHTVGGSRNVMHLIASHPDEVWAVSSLNELCTASKEPEQLVSLLKACDSGGRTPFFVALENGNITTALAMLEEVESACVAAKCDDATKLAAISPADLGGTPPLHALLGLSVHAVPLPEGNPPLESSCSELVEKMLNYEQLRTSQDLNGLSALEAYTVLGPLDRLSFAAQCGRSLQAVQRALSGECAAVDVFVWSLLCSQTGKQELAKAVTQTAAKLFTFGITHMSSTAERWVQAVVRVLTTTFAGAATRDASDPLRESLVGALHMVPEAAIKCLSETASLVLKPMRLGMPLVASGQPGAHLPATEIGRVCFGGSGHRRCGPANSSKQPAANVLASSSQRSAGNILLPGLDRYWQSNGAMNTHWLEFEFAERDNVLESLEMYCSASSDDSYCPQEVRVTVRENADAGEAHTHVLAQEGWTELLTQPIETPGCVHIAFVRTRGHNIKIRTVKMRWGRSGGGSLSGPVPGIPDRLIPKPAPTPDATSNANSELPWVPSALARKREASTVSTSSKETRPPAKQDPRIVCASTFNFLVRTMVEIYKSAFVAKEELCKQPTTPVSNINSVNDIISPKSPTTMGILNKARGALRSKKIEDAMLCAGYQLDSSWEWIFHVMDSTQAQLKAAELRVQRLPRTNKATSAVATAELHGGLLACLRAAHGDVLSVAPNVTEANYGHVAIVLDAIVAWQSCGVQEWLHKDRMMRNVSHLRKVTDPVAEIAREHVEAKSPPREAITSQPWKEQGLVDILARWDMAIAKFANEFSEAEAVVGPDSFLHLMASYEKKEKRFRTEMAQLRREKCEGRKLLFNVSRDTKHNIFQQVSRSMDLCYVEVTAQNPRDTNAGKPSVPPLAVQTLTAKFEGELGEGSALLRSCLAQVAHVLRFDEDLLTSDQSIEETSDAQEQLRHFSPASWSTREPERLQKFRNVGRLLGLSLLFDCRLPVFFHRHVYKYLLGRRVSLADLAYYKGDTYTSITNLIKTIAKDPSFDISSMSLEFSAQWTPDGNAIPVTRNNWAAYVRRFAKGEMIDGVKLELENMKIGLLDVVPEISLQGLTAEDLQLLLAGKSGDVSVQDFVGRLHFVDSRTSEGRGNDPNELADLERCVWAVLRQFSVDERLALIAFGTGTPVLPEELGFHLEDPPSSSAAGPFARQCENYITVPSYPNLDEELLAQVLRNAARTTVRYDTI